MWLFHRVDGQTIFEPVDLYGSVSSAHYTRHHQSVTRLETFFELDGRETRSHWVIGFVLGRHVRIERLGHHCNKVDIAT